MEEHGIGTNPGGVMEGAGVSGGAVMGGDAEIARLRSVLADEIARRESAEAEVARLTAERDALRAVVARVEALADQWADRKRSDGMSGNAWIGLTLSGVAADLRAALATTGEGQ